MQISSIDGGLWITARTDEDAATLERIDAEIEQAALDSQSAVIMGLPSSQCCSFVFSRDDSRRIKTRNLLIYELEDLLPLDADTLSVGRISCEQSELVLAIDSQEFVPIGDAIRANGIHLRAITPIVLLAFAGLSREQDMASEDLVYWGSENGADLIWLESGIPSKWNWISASDTDAIRNAAVQIAESNSSARLLVLGQPPDLTGLDDRVEVTLLDRDQLDIACQESQRILNGVAQPLVDLREGPLQSDKPFYSFSRSLAFSACAILFSQVVLLLALVIWHKQYRGESERYRQKSVAAYRRIFPDSPVPVGVRSRLESEHRRLLGTKGLASHAIPRLGNVIPMLHAFLSALPEPATARFQFDRIELTPGNIAIATGTAKSFEDQETVAKRLRIAGLDVPPLSAEAQGNGVSLRLESVGWRKAKQAGNQQ